MPNPLSSRNLLLFTILSIFISQVFPIAVCASKGNYLNIDRPLGKIDVLERDVFAVFLSPRIENLSARCQPLNRGGLFDLSISTRYVDLFLGEVSVVGVQLNGPGIYNLTISFASNESWKYTLGVFTRNLKFYEEYWGQGIITRGSFVERASFTRHSGNWTIIIPLESHSLARSFSYFPYITLPTPVNMALLLAAWILIAYVNSFVFLDTYFKSKKEIVSYTRWIMVGVMILISVYFAYQIYRFTTFTLSEGG